jgi:hypothetical protein
LTKPQTRHFEEVKKPARLARYEMSALSGEEIDANNERRNLKRTHKNHTT